MASGVPTIGIRKSKQAFGRECHLLWDDLRALVVSEDLIFCFIKIYRVWMAELSKADGTKVFLGLFRRDGEYSAEQRSFWQLNMIVSQNGNPNIGYHPYNPLKRYP